MRTPSAAKHVAYYMMRRRDSVAAGVGPAQQAAAWKPPRTAAQIQSALTSTAGAWAVRLTSDPRRALLEAQGARRRQAKSTPTSPSMYIAAVDLSKVEGHVMDISDGPARLRAELKGAKLQFASKQRPMLVMGDATSPPAYRPKPY